MAWVAARKVSTPRATCGCIHSVWSAVIRPSRPNGVQNQGTPRIRIEAVRGIGGKDGKISGGVIEPVVELLVIGTDLERGVVALRLPPAVTG